jgi:regulation of enolase protein 1 (concanavalin A-like superfamily)
MAVRARDLSFGNGLFDMLIEHFEKRGLQAGRIDIEGNDVVIEAAPNTDWFFDPRGKARLRNVPSVALSTQTPVFALQAKVSAGFGSRFDGGTIFVQASDTAWAKIAFEYSPQHVPTIVSVVTKDVSDDCDGPSFEKEAVYLRLSAQDGTFAFHFSETGSNWRFLRWFSLSYDSGPLTIGLSAQSPLGNGCRVRFSDISLTHNPITDLRDGS